MERTTFPELSQVEVFFGVLYRAFFAFGLAWLFYIALEPYAQGLWPQTLISWVRLLEGLVRDPRVGRDVLLGCAYGIGGALAVHAFRLAPLWLGSVPGRTDFPHHPAELIALRGVKESLAELFAIQLNISIHILYLIVGLLLLRFVFRRTWLAVGIHATLYVSIYGSGFRVSGHGPLDRSVVSRLLPLRMAFHFSGHAHHGSARRLSPDNRSMGVVRTRLDSRRPRLFGAHPLRLQGFAGRATGTQGSAGRGVTAIRTTLGERPVVITSVHFSST